MEQNEHFKGLTLREVDQINLDIEYVSQFLSVLARLEEGGGAVFVRKGALTYEAMDRMRRIDQIINPGLHPARDKEGEA